MNFKQLVLEELTFNELALQAEKDNLPQWRANLEKIIGKEVCVLGAIIRGVNFSGPWTLLGKNPKRVQGGWRIQNVDTKERKIAPTPRIYPIEYMTLNQLSDTTRDTFGDIINEL
jgi:hypothetical protein